MENEWDDDKSGEGAPETISDEERDTIRTLRETGMTATEVVSRARRDYQNEIDGANAPTTPPAKSEAVEDGESLVSRQELDGILDEERAKAQQEARAAGRMAVAAESQSQHLHSAVDNVISEELGDMPDYKIEQLKSEVNKRAAKNVKALSMSAADFQEHVEKVAAEVCKEERETARSMGKAEREADMDARLGAHATASSGGQAGGGSGKHSVAGKSQAAVNADELDNPAFGMLSEKKSWPTDDEINDAHIQELAEFNRTAKVGR